MKNFTSDNIYSVDGSMCCKYVFKLSFIIGYNVTIVISYIIGIDRQISIDYKS